MNINWTRLSVVFFSLAVLGALSIAPNSGPVRPVQGGDAFTGGSAAGAAAGAAAGRQAARDDAPEEEEDDGGGGGSCG